MAVGEDDPRAVQILLEAGADPDLRTRIDDHDTPLEMAESAARHEVAAVLTQCKNPPRRRRR